jgi:hypothetical protein
VTARAVGLLILAAAAVSCGPATSRDTQPVVGHVAGSATYQTIVGGQAQVQLFIGDFNHQVPHLVLTFLGQTNWLLQHRSISNDSTCQVGQGVLDCGAFSTNEWGDLFLSGGPRRAGVFNYTLALWSEQHGHLESIHSADGRPLVVSWVEVVNTP